MYAYTHRLVLLPALVREASRSYTAAVIKRTITGQRGYSEREEGKSVRKKRMKKSVP